MSNELHSPSPPPPPDDSRTTKELPAYQEPERTPLTRKQHLERMLVSGLRQKEVISQGVNEPITINTIDLNQFEKELLHKTHTILVAHADDLVRAHQELQQISASLENGENPAIFMGIPIVFVTDKAQMVGPVDLVDGIKNVSQLDVDFSGNKPQWRILIYQPYYEELDDSTKLGEFMHEYFSLLVMTNGTMNAPEEITKEEKKQQLEAWKRNNMPTIRNYSMSQILDGGYKYYLSGTITEGLFID